MQSRDVLKAMQDDAGIELAYFDSGQDPGSRHLDWYRNGFLRDGWTDEMHLLGHPLGGHGREWSAYGSATLPATDVQWRVFHRTRNSQNLFAPGYTGTSAGGSLVAQRRFAGGWSADLNATLERGSAINEWSLDLVARKWFMVR